MFSSFLRKRSPSQRDLVVAMLRPLRCGAVARGRRALCGLGDDDDALARLQEERAFLTREARVNTLSLWRRCLRSVAAIRGGNDHDEAGFAEREEVRLSGTSANLFEMPVDREDELESRANYYYQWSRENVEQESDCLDRQPMLLESDVERYVQLLRSGEERRQWLLRDYKFKDPCDAKNDKFVTEADGTTRKVTLFYDSDRMDRFETRAKEFIRNTYALKGWSLKEDQNNSSLQDDDDWDDDGYDDKDDDFFDGEEENKNSKNRRF